MTLLSLGYNIFSEAKLQSMTLSFKLVFTSNRVCHIRSCNNAYHLVKIEVWDHKPSHKLGRIGVKPGTFQMNLLLISLMTVALILLKLHCQRWKQKWDNKPITMLDLRHSDWLIFLLLLATPTIQFSQIKSNGVVNGISIMLPAMLV